MAFSIEALIEERDSLKENLDRLNAFIVKIGNGEVSSDELKSPMRLLTAQANAMCEYVEVLNERILVAEFY